MILDADFLKEIAKAPVAMRAITNHRVLNEAYEYAKPSSFSRGMRIDLNGLAILLISGTASVDEYGRSIHIDDFRAQTRRTFQNITGLLESEGATWKDVVRTTCYLRDIERDYSAFNEERTAFTRSRNSIHFRLRREFRRFCAGPSCWLKSKPSPCSGPNRKSKTLKRCSAGRTARCAASKTWSSPRRKWWS